MLELDGGRYAKGDAHYNDMCYYIAASRAAIRAGKRTVKRTGSTKKISHKEYERATDKRRQRERSSETVKRAGAVMVRGGRVKRRLLSGPARMAQLRSNKSYLPGD